MKISVITVCRNAEYEIEKTILSVINQTYKNFEYIIIDGASSDATLSILSKYEEKISLLISEPDVGIYDAMNKGIDYATGDIICFMNAGDGYSSTDVFEMVINSFTCSFPRPEIVYGDTIVISKGGMKETLSAYRYNLVGFVLEGPICHQSTFINRNLFTSKYSLKYRICADFEWLLNRLIIKNNHFLYLSSPLSVYQLGGFSAQNLRLFEYEYSKISLKYLIILLFCSPIKIIDYCRNVGFIQSFTRIGILILLVLRM